MAKERTYSIPNVNAPSKPVIFNTEICNGCNICVEHCPLDVFIPNPVKGQSPIILHPDECWYCGSCVNDCHRPGAITFNWPLQQRGYWKNKATGKISRV
jgi:NAD-dependent dihydropyrimidine dehydrogenase PreA subunit